jgi:hypothetical protein
MVWRAQETVFWQSTSENSFLIEAANIADPEFACDPEGDIILGSPTGTNGYRAPQCHSLVDKMEAACGLPELLEKARS